MKKKCFNCYFASKYLGESKNSLNEEERLKAAQNVYPLKHDSMAIECYRGMWSEGISGRQVAQQRLKDYSCSHFAFYKKHQGMFFKAVISIEEIKDRIVVFWLGLIGAVSGFIAALFLLIDFFES